MNRLKGLGNLLKGDLEKSVSDISNSRNQIAQQIMNLGDNLKFAITRNPSMNTAFTQIGDYASDQDTGAIIQFHKLLVILVKATAPLLATSPATPADSLAPIFADLIKEGTRCVNTVSDKIAQGFKDATRATFSYNVYDRMQPVTSKLENPFVVS